MAVLARERSVVVVIDMQGKLVELVERHAMTLEANRRLLRLAGLFEVPVILTEQYPSGLGGTQPDLLGEFDALAVPKWRVEKDTFGCCAEPSFRSALEHARPGVALGDLQVVVGGIEAHVCVMQTTLELLERGAVVHLCWECVSGRGAEYRERALSRMEQAGATITNHESVGFEWCRDKNHPRFKELSRMLRAGQPQ